MYLPGTFQIKQAGGSIFHARKTLAWIYTAIALLLFTARATAIEVMELSVTETQNEYSVRIVAVLDAPRDHVYKVITDYSQANLISPSITSIDIQPPGQDSALRVKHHSKHRIGPFTFEVDWAGDIVESGQGTIRITTVPEISSFESGFAYWEISTQGDRTYVRHESSMKPKFSIPPLFGKYIMKKHMKKETLTTFNRIEHHALELLERDSGVRPDLMHVQSGDQQNPAESRAADANLAAIIR